MATGGLNDKNIIIGAASVFISVADSENGTLPTKVTNFGSGTAPFAPADEWRNVGFTMEGVEVSYEPDYGDVEVDQLLDSARIFKQSMRVTANTTLAEATLENLLVVWGQAGDASGNTVSILGGSLGQAPTERGLLFVGPAPKSATNKRQERVYQILRAIQTESTSFALRRNETTGLPASFRCLPDANASGGASYGAITDRAVQA